jgi:glutathione S-transferase
MRATLYGLPGSHPSKAAELMLRFKGVPYRRVDLPNGTHRAILRGMGFGVSTAPVMTLDGRRVTTTKRITRALEAAMPSPPLLPVDPVLESWADEDLQDCVRQLGRWGAVHDRASMATFLDGARMGLPVGVIKAALPVIGPLTAMQMRVPDAVARDRLAALGGLLDRVDALLAEGTIGGARLNALDFQIAPSVRLAMAFGQLRDAIAARPAGAHALLVCPDFPGSFGPVLPADWLRT